MPSEVTYAGLIIVLDSYVKTRFPNKQYGWQIVKTKHQSTKGRNTVWAHYDVTGQYVPSVYGSPNRHSYKLIIKDILGEIVCESEETEAVRSNAFDGASLGLFLATLKEVE